MEFLYGSNCSGHKALSTAERGFELDWLCTVRVNEGYREEVSTYRPEGKDYDICFKIFKAGGGAELQALVVVSCASGGK